MAFPEIERPAVGLESGGWCARCGRRHALPLEPARADALVLMEALMRHRRLDFARPESQAEAGYSTAPLFGEPGGKMFGVLRCRDARGETMVLRAFSGQWHGRWEAPGWVPPVFDPVALEALTRGPEAEIKEIGREMAALPREALAWRDLSTRRRSLSRQLMQRIFALYQLHNFRGESAPLTAIYQGPGLPPTGTGDCCAPKLLQAALHLRLRPEGLAEFYWGRPNASDCRHHGAWYPACAAKCEPILGFLLCGLE